MMGITRNNCFSLQNARRASRLLAISRMSGSKLSPEDKELVARAFELLDEDDTGQISAASATSMLERLGFDVTRDKRVKLSGLAFSLKQMTEVQRRPY